MAEDGRPRGEPRIARSVRLLAVLVFAATAFFPVHGCGPGPGPRPEPISRMGRAPANLKVPAPEEEVQVPFEEMRSDGARGWREDGLLGAVWSLRIWYPYVLVPIWVAGILLSALGARLARAGGWLLLGTSVAIALFELAYISYQFRGFLPSLLRPLEVGLAWLLVLAVLFLRRGRSALDAEATVSAHALLSILHAFTYPVSDVRGWLDSGHGWGPIVASLLHDYRPAFFVAVGALAVAAVPGYVRFGVRRAVPVAPPAPVPSGP